ncbi:transposase [Crenobacter oryzisoli]|uniref:transposase n=1 Tax=Crenobacter oryzisoli TaxID=3056844 RepID=UPI003F494E97
MTNLLDAQAFPAADFGALYHQRWRIEEAFKRLKHPHGRHDPGRRAPRAECQAYRALRPRHRRGGTQARHGCLPGAGRDDSR